MNPSACRGKSVRRHGQSGLSRLWHGLTLPLLVVGVMSWMLAPSAEALTLNVVDATNGTSISAYKYLINEDNTGTTEQRSPTSGSGCNTGDLYYPYSCNWASIKGVDHPSPIYTHGDDTDIGSVSPPDGRYLISVLADGYKIDGAHFTVPTSGPVTVEMQPNPLPDSTIRAAVFADIAPTNGTPDVGDPGLPGFVGHIVDYIGEVQTDVYGNPLCTVYQGEDPVTHVIPPDALDADMLPVVQTIGGSCVSDANGELVIPHLGTNRYTLYVVPPDGQTWIQTTTLEGNHDWDTWIMEGSTGYDTEFVLAGEPFPQPIFGFAPPTNTLAGGSGHITGVVVGIKTYTPPKGGAFDFWGGNTGTKIDHPIESPWLSLADLQAGDVAVWVGQGDANGHFDISGVPDGNYTLSWWDEPQDYNLNFINVTVANGETVDMGNLPLNGWWTVYDGYVFEDLNRNGVRDPDEQGVPNFTLTMRRRENSLMDRGQNVATTDQSGYYLFESGYPLGEWSIMEAYSDGFYTTGVTYQADNQPSPTTVKGAGVDVSVLNIIGLSGRLDWGVHHYDPTGANGIDPRNGGIVGTVSYDTTRNELDPQYAAAEDWQPGVSDLTVELYATVVCGTTRAPCDSIGRYELAADGSYAKGNLLNTYVTEHWSRPTGCTARDVDGNPLIHGVDENVLVTNQETAGECIESFMQGVQFGPYPTDQGTPDANFGAAVDGNYGFGDGCFDGTLDATDPADPVCTGGTFSPLPAGDYLVRVVIPNDASGMPMYQVTREEDINIGNGDQIIPQVPPPACAGALHTVDVAGFGTDGYPAVDLFGDGSVIVPASTPVDNPTFVDIDGSPYEGTPRPLCDTKLVNVSNGKSIVPIFNVFTDVPIPARLRGFVVDDINFSTDPRSIMYGEKSGVPFTPVGVYDFRNRLVTTLESDFNGVYEVLLPSTNHISCPTPSGVCANMYRFVANDPGVPGRLNPNYNPRYRTIATEFEAFPGLIIPTDLAPTQVGLTIEAPATGIPNAVTCALDAATPQLFAVDQPYVDDSGSFTISGLGFGTTAGQVTLDGTIVLPTTSWSDTSIDVTVPAGTPYGPHQLKITAANGQSTVNGLTFHVIGSLPAFPATPVLDNFNRTGFGPNWQVDNVFTLNNNNVRVTGTGTMRWGGTAGGGPVYAANQEAYFTFVKVSPTATEQGLFLKVTGNGNNPNPTANGSAYIEVSYKGNNPTSVQVRTKANGTNTVVLQATFPATFAAGDTLGARALADGTVIAYKNGFEINRVNVTTTANPWPVANASAGGRLGIRFVGAQNNTTNDARFDDFGGGSITASSYAPYVYEVGPGRTYAVIQDAIDAAVASAGDDLVVVYPGQPNLADPRANPRGAYYENLIITTPIKLQGVGPGGFQSNIFVPGSILDGGAFGGDTDLATAWYAKVGTLTWDGNQNVNDGEVIYILAHDGVFTANFKASIDGFDVRGGDQRGFPGNINDLTGMPTGLPPGIVTQGGAILANAYARYLQITNNVVENNGGGYGTVRIGTPDLPEPDTSQHNEYVRIANNRIIQNAGTNLAGGIGLFAGADNYEVAYNDICANFSVEYGGGLSVYGRSPNGQIHHNRIYFNMSNDEGGGIMIAGELPAITGTLSPGSGPVDIYNNQIQANLANDDGGGLRFLMAGGFGGVDAMNVYNNMIVNNVSTHEGGGIGLNDAPNVRIFNNTIMKNLTTATAITSTGQPAPAGISTSANSAQLQATLPGGSPLFSNPLLFNNVLWDNRAGTRAGTTVTGIGLVGDASPIDYWDVGVADGTGLLAPTNSIVQQDPAIHPYTVSPTNNSSDPMVLDPSDVSVSFATWRQNPGFVDATLVALEQPPNLLGDYHLTSSSPAISLGAVAASGVNAPASDFDNQPRPLGAGFDSGADEF
jgi:SdrD B-like domain/IPT/TIG domain